MNKKICSVCKLEKDFSNFHKGKDKHGLSCRCKDCCREYAKKNVKRENERKINGRLKIMTKFYYLKKNIIKKIKKKRMLEITYTHVIKKRITQFLNCLVILEVGL